MFMSVGNRPRVLLAGGVVLVMFAAACGSGEGGEVSGDAANGIVNGETIATPDMVTAACKEGSVNFYTAQTADDERAIIKPFEKAFPCVNVSIVSAVTGRLYERLLTEDAGKSATADVALLTDVALVQGLTDKGLVADWTPKAASKYPADRKKDGKWYSASASVMYYVYNNQLVKEDDAPKSWDDLLDPKWHGKISTSPPTIGGTAWDLYWFLQEKLPGNYWKGLAKQEPKMFEAYAGVVSSVARGETAIGIECDLCDYPARTKQGAPLTPVFPTEGVVYVPYPMLILADSPHRNAAQLFGAWYLSKQGQEQVVSVRGAYSGREDVAPAPGKPALTTLKTFTPPTDLVVKEHEQLISDFHKVFRTG